MFRHFTLDALRLVPPEGYGECALLSSRKRLALLVYLAIADRRFSSRDSLVALFWPDSDHNRARRSLNQALHVIRQSLSPGIVEVRGGEELRIAPGALWCDVVAFREAVAAGRMRDALVTYRGDLLGGFFVRGAAGFEQWLEAEREALRKEAAAAAWAVVETNAAGTGGTGLASSLRQAIQLGGWDDEVATRAMRLAAGAGNRSLALQLYGEFEQWLEQELETEPAPLTQRLAHELRNGRPMRAEDAADIANQSPVQVAGSAARPQDERAVSPSKPPDGGRAPAGGGFLTPLLSLRSARVRIGTVLTIFALSLAALHGRIGVAREDAEAAAPQAVVVVGHFADLNAPRQASPLATALTLALTEELARATGLRVFAVAQAGPPAPTERGTGPSVSVDGSINAVGDSLAVTARVTESASGAVLGVFAVKVSRGPEPHGEIAAAARALATLLRRRMGDELRVREWRDARYGSASMASFERARQLVDAARRLHRDGSIPAALTTLELADSLLHAAELQHVDRAEPLLARAQLSETWAWLNFVPPLHDTAASRIALARGIAHAQRALALQPRHPAALEQRASLGHLLAALTKDEAVAATRLEAVEADLRAAVEADPGRSAAWSLLSAVLFARGAFVQANWAARHADADVHLDNPQEILGRLYITAHEIGDDAAAEAWCREIETRFRRTWPAIECRLTLLAWSTVHPPGTVSPDTVRRLLEQSADPTPIALAMRPRLELLAATVLARHGAIAEANAIAARLSHTATANAELMPRMAALQLALGQQEEAIRGIEAFMAQRPRQAGFLASRRFLPLRDDPRIVLLTPPEAVTSGQYATSLRAGGS